MRQQKKTVFRVWLILAIAAVGVFTLFRFSALAGNPHSAFYSAANNRVFWFVHISDIHIGARGSQDSDYLSWVVGPGKTVIDPEFIVATGDLTDSTNGNILGYPNGPYQEEWDAYKAILNAAGMNASYFYDIPGNHDAYSDQYFSYYLNNSIQGQATGQTQVSWIRQFDFGKYHFLGVNSSDNTGDPFSLTWPWGDYAGLDSTELDFINSRLAENTDADLTFVFGHHPVTDTGYSDDTWLYYGSPEFVSYLDLHGVSQYGYGHTHRYEDVLFAGDSYTGYMSGDAVRYFNIASLGKSDNYHYSVIAVDCNGISAAAANYGEWPVVLITAPMDKMLGGSPNPFAYTVPGDTDNPIRALVFDDTPVSGVLFRIDGTGDWMGMTQVPDNSRLWEAVFDASSLSAGDHALEVQANGSSLRSDTITFTVTTTNTAPVAADDNYSVGQDAVLSVPAPGVLGNDTDADGDPLTAVLGAAPVNGDVVLDPDGSFSYTPDPGFSGSDSFSYTADDGEAVSSPAFVTVTINPVGPDTITILAASYNPKPRKLMVEATSSSQPDAVLTVVGYGEMVWSSAEQKYLFNSRVSPPPGDSVTVTSDLGGADTWFFNAGMNSPPTANDQNVTVQKNTPKNITLTASDPDGDALTYAVVISPSHGSLSGTAPDLVYTPDSDYTGSDSFTFQANDGQVDSNVATVSITVTDSSTDTVVILSALYKTKPKQLSVEATSTLQPDAVLTLVGYGEMTYDAAAQKYVFSGKVSTPPGATVTVMSNLGGSDTKPVTLK